MLLRPLAAVVGLLLASAPLLAAGTYHEVSYPPSDKPGELIFGVSYTVWIPDGVAKLRGVIVHQHGCGAGACKGGETAAYDLHWQALAKKWDCALLGPSFKQEDAQNCRLWCDPRNGSAKTFLRALADLSQKAGKPELATVPWCLWGHSGGGFWASIVQTMYPERVVAVWCRSGTGFTAWDKGEIPKPELSDEVYRVPVMCPKHSPAKRRGSGKSKTVFGSTCISIARFRQRRRRSNEGKSQSQERLSYVGESLLRLAFRRLSLIQFMRCSEFETAFPSRMIDVPCSR